MLDCSVLTYSNGRWEEKGEAGQKMVQGLDHGKTQVIGTCDQNIVHYFGIKSYCLTSMCLESNGYSGAEPVLDDKGNLQHFDHWSRFAIKQVRSHLRPNRTFTRHEEIANEPKLSNGCKSIHTSQSIEYGWEWIEISIFARWSPPSNITMLCLNVPKKLQDSIQSALKKNASQIDLLNPYSIFAVLLVELTSAYDKSVWSIRDRICEWEARQRQNTDYPLLHEITRHAIHVCETLGVARNCVEDMQQQETRFKTIHNTTTSSWNGTQSSLQFPLCLLRSLLARSESNKARIQNETTLAFHTSASRDTQIQLRLAEEATKETLAMKVIAVITLTFLPSTFISSVFSMSFFYYQPGQNGESDVFAISDKFWIFWVMAVPVSLATVSIWVFWDQFQGRVLGFSTKNDKFQRSLSSLGV